MTDTSRQRTLEDALFALYEHWWKELGYRAERFRQTIVPGCKRYKGGVNAVKDILLKRTGGFERLSAHPKLTVEHLVASGEWNDLFHESLRALAREKLKEVSK
jgi:hypothetical protein